MNWCTCYDTCPSCGSSADNDGADGALRLSEDGRVRCMSCGADWPTAEAMRKEREEVEDFFFGDDEDTADEDTGGYVPDGPKAWL